MRQPPRARALSGALLMLCACSGPDDSNIFDGDGVEGTTGSVNAGSTSSVTGGTNGPASSATSADVAAASTSTSASTTTGTAAGSGGSGGSTSATQGSVSTSTASAVGGASSTTSTTSTTSSSSTTGSGGSAGSGAAGGSGGSGGSDTGTGGTGGDACTPTDEICDGQDNDCDEDVDEDACPVGCKGGHFEGHRYMFCNAPSGANGNGRPARSWSQAMQFCMNHDQWLVRVESEPENGFVYRSLNETDGSGDVWMGATDQEDEDEWSWAVSSDPDDWVLFYDADEREPVDGAFIDWREGEPNDMGGEDCGVFEAQGGGAWLWDDRSCSTDFDRLVCEGAD